MLLVWAPLASLALVGQEHGRTIPLGDIGEKRGRVCFGPSHAVRSDGSRKD
jgi:hypothetical protein